MNKYVYILWHIHEEGYDTEDNKLLGIYTSQKKVQEKIEEYKLLPGFCNYPEGFVIDKYILNQDQWTEGFTTIYI